MAIEFLLKVMQENKHRTAIVWHDKNYNYQWLLDTTEKMKQGIIDSGVKQGDVVAVEADFSPTAVAALLALIQLKCVFVPLTSAVKEKAQEFIEVGQCEWLAKISATDQIEFPIKLNNTANHPHYQHLRKTEHPGLVLFSSGSTGKSKAAVHDLIGILEKFKVTRNRVTAVTFLLYDHIGGLNTLLYLLSNGGTIVTVPDRSPDAVLSSIDKYQVALLPTSPTFINLVLISEAYKRYDLSTLKTVTYGTEPMPESTLKRFNKLFPEIRLQQTYGLSEIGILRSKSKNSHSLWVKLGGEGFKTRVVDNIFQIKAQSAMLGYLNAPNPFTKDGWFITGDLVEQEGDYFKIIGRKSEIINVGGEKVHPVEIESTLQKLDIIAEVTVYPEANMITGQMVCVKVRLKQEEDKKLFKIRLKKYCKQHLQSYKRPVRIKIDKNQQFSERFKKVRA